MKPNKKRRNKLEKKFDEMPKPYAEGLWDEAILENNSYWDLILISKHNESILKEIKYWKEEYQPSGNMGKWWRSIRLERLYKKLKHYK